MARSMSQLSRDRIVKKVPNAVKIVISEGQNIPDSIGNSIKNSQTNYKNIFTSQKHLNTQASGKKFVNAKFLDHSVNSSAIYVGGSVTRNIYDSAEMYSADPDLQNVVVNVKLNGKHDQSDRDVDDYVHFKEQSVSQLNQTDIFASRNYRHYAQKMARY